MSGCPSFIGHGLYGSPVALARRCLRESKHYLHRRLVRLGGCVGLWGPTAWAARPGGSEYKRYVMPFSTLLGAIVLEPISTWPWETGYVWNFGPEA